MRSGVSSSNTDLIPTFNLGIDVISLVLGGVRRRLFSSGVVLARSVDYVFSLHTFFCAGSVSPLSKTVI